MLAVVFAVGYSIVEAVVQWGHILCTRHSRAAVSADGRHGRRAEKMIGGS